jgi:hypothetical protein
MVGKQRISEISLSQADGEHGAKARRTESFRYEWVLKNVPT